jgi:hypothetical protein
MDESNEQVNFDDQHAPIYRIDRNDLYIALQPPDAAPYVVAGRDMEADFIVKFIQDRVPLLRELRADMLKRYEKSPSLECRYQTGDVAYLFGRPFMLRVSTLGKSKMKAGMHGRVNVNATMHNDVSLINLYVMQMGSYDQRRAAYTAWADGVFLMNARSITEGCARTANITATAPATVRTRDMPSSWCQMDVDHGITWMSRRLAPYPPECIAYAFMAAAARTLLPADATEAQRHALIEAGCPTWEHAQATLNDKTSPFARQ